MIKKMETAEGEVKTLEISLPDMKRRERKKLLEETEGHRESQLQIVERSASQKTSNFELPNDWIVEERPRSKSSSKHVDRYYYEPGSGRQFRSLISVQRYLNEGMEDLPNRTVTSRIYENSRYLNAEMEDLPNRAATSHIYEKSIVPQLCSPCSRFQIPSGWKVETKPRSRSNIIDRYYIEPGTGVRFRSLRSVERYLGSPKFGDRCMTLAEPSKVNTRRRKRLFHEGVGSSMLDFSNTPSKVKWVLGGPRGNLWCASIDESLVPELVMQTWSKTFILSMQDDDE